MNFTLVNKILDTLIGQAEANQTDGSDIGLLNSISTVGGMKTNNSFDIGLKSGSKFAGK